MTQFLKASKKSILLALIAALLPMKAFAQDSEESENRAARKEAVMNALINMKSVNLEGIDIESDEARSLSKFFFDSGSIVTGAGITYLMGLTITEKAIRVLTPEGFVKVLNKAGAGIIKVGVGTTFLAAAVYAFEPTAVGKATLSDYYLTAQGFQQFIKLPIKQQEFYVSLNKDLEDAVLKLSETIDKIAAEKDFRPSI